MTLLAVLSYIPLSRPHGVALVLIYPCGKAQEQPPKGAALKARRRTYEMARDWSRICKSFGSGPPAR